jgi:hypothetical protein
MTSATGLHDIGPEGFSTPLERLEFASRRDTTTMAGQARTKDVGDEDQRVFSTDRTCRRGAQTELARSTDQFGMRITDLIAAEPTPVVLVDEVPARQTMIDGPRGTVTSQRCRRERHKGRLPSARGPSDRSAIWSTGRATLLS